MAKYNVKAWRDFTHCAEIEVEADTPEQAITIATQKYEDGDGDWEDCGVGGEDIHEMRAEPPYEEEERAGPDGLQDSAAWRLPADRAKQCGPDLLAALKAGVRLYERELLHLVPTKEAAAFLEKARAAIAKADDRPATVPA